MSSKVYCSAQFLPKAGHSRELFKVLQSLEPNTLREDGCLHYVVTRQIHSPFAEGSSFPIVFHETWRDMASFEAHCQRREIVDFFERYCLAEDGWVEDWNVCVYTDEPEDLDQ
ncbi:putative quinol monooxygenase [Nitrincola tapanii]|uniref:Antibiotic biosynthesis monooxygenase n=1 Tax=Nitrincola tapanii TaxID=1708751 RepID=A0A5A9W360_9GAMM|nr:antibiotic biosynthesis monooxygenase [Nitrincola tapanii]KAA0875032.1 antibiotic biosynthesis monooxygenase [Nitrincola tapanii]